MQDRKKDTDVYSRLLDSEGEGTDSHLLLEIANFLVTRFAFEEKKQEVGENKCMDTGGQGVGWERLGGWG